MKKRLIPIFAVLVFFILVAALLSIAKMAEAKPNRGSLGVEIGVLNRGEVVYQFTSPSGAVCIFVGGHAAGSGLSCDFNK